RARGLNGVVLAPDLHAQLGPALRLPRRLELDLVDVGRGQHERDDHADVEQADHRDRSDPWRTSTSLSAATRGSEPGDAPASMGASVGSAARSLAERARGLALISA